VTRSAPTISDHNDGSPTKSAGAIGSRRYLEASTRLAEVFSRTNVVDDFRWHCLDRSPELHVASRPRLPRWRW
jgi:hypothetical protein